MRRADVGRWATVLLWLFATAIAMFLSLLVIDAAYFDGDWIPTGNDSFYHARRMLDLAVGERGFYQFDERIHVPDGSWIPWPWAYDYLMGQAAALAVWLRPSTDPLGFLLHVPPLWLGVNAALFLAAARLTGLGLASCALAMLAFALAPFVQLMHMVGRVDHHFAEFTFVLLAIYSGLRWFATPRNRAAGIGLGAVLGVAPAFHNGLFVLQIPVLACAGLLWLRASQLPRPGLHAVALSLVASTLLVLLPSAPFRAGLFEFGLLSWFHLYVAICSAAVLVFFGWRTCDRPSLLLLAAAGILLAIPLAGQATHGLAFLSRDLPFLENVLEATSPLALSGRFGTTWVMAHYSWMLLVAPPLLLYFLWRLWRETDPGRLFFAVMTVFGLAFMLTQFRFYYFGLFSLIVGSLVVIQCLAERHDWHRGLVFVAVLAGLLIAYQPSLRHKLFDVYALGAAPLYERARPAFLDLAERCAEDPGLVLANHHDGNYVLFHSECTVISNTFMLSDEDENRIRQLDAMMRLTPEALREHQPEVKYVFLRVQDFAVVRDGKFQISDASPLGKALLADAKLPDGYELIRTLFLEENGEMVLYAKAFAVH